MKYESLSFILASVYCLLLFRSLAFYGSYVKNNTLALRYSFILLLLKVKTSKFSFFLRLFDHENYILRLP